MKWLDTVQYNSSLLYVAQQAEIHAGRYDVLMEVFADLEVREGDASVKLSSEAKGVKRKEVSASVIFFKPILNK